MEETWRNGDSFVIGVEDCQSDGEGMVFLGTNGMIILLYMMKVRRQSKRKRTLR